MSKSKVNWESIQVFYDLGNSIEDVHRELGISYGSMSAAVKRGDLKRRSHSEAAKIVNAKLYKTDFDWNEIQEFYDSGHTWREIIEKYSISISRLSQASKKGTFKTRTNGEAHSLSARQNPRTHTEETKKKISESRKKFLLENPEKASYVLYHYSKGESYPEKYFNMIFKKHFTFDRYYRIGLYQLDFAIVEKRIYIEIDGGQHRWDPKIVESDKRKDKYLENLGWTGIRVNWSDYKRLQKHEREKYVRDMVDYISQLKTERPTFEIIPNECGKEKSISSGYCKSCSPSHRTNNRKVERPPYDILLKEIEESNFSALGRKYGVADNVIRKWMKKYERDNLRSSTKIVEQTI